MSFVRAIVISLVAVSVLLPDEVDAALDHWSTPVSNVAGTITAGEINVYIQHPEAFYGRVGDVMHMSALLTAPSATNPVATWLINHSHGCVTSSPTTRTTSSGVGVVSSFDFDVSTNDTTCSVSLRLNVTAGLTNVLIYDQQLTVTMVSEDVQCSTRLLALDPKGCNASTFEVVTGMRAWDFGAVFFVLLMALFIWHRSTDVGAQLVMALVFFIISFILLQILLSNQIIGFNIVLIVFSAVCGFYMAAKSLFDMIRGKKEAEVT